MMTAPSAERAGSWSLGPYEIRRELGRGGMGVVYESWDPLLERPVALKVIHHPKFLTDADADGAQAALFREARSAARLSHQNIVTIFKAGRIDHTAYIEMELVDGRTLEQMLESSLSMLPVDHALRILKQVAAALDYAHLQGVVHRDIKPGNLMLCSDGTVRIMDFGIARIWPEQTLAWEPEQGGSPLFMAPEQLRGEVATTLTDQYALATIAYRLLTGVLPFQAEHSAQIAYKIIFEQPVPPSQRLSTLSHRVDAVFRRALSKQPADRYTTSIVFLRALESALAEPAIEATSTGSFRPIDPVVTLPPPAPEIISLQQRPMRFFSRHPFLSGVLFTLLVMSALFLLYLKLFVPPASGGAVPQPPGQTERVGVRPHR